MGGESPNVILYDVNGQEMSVSNGAAIPAGTSALMIAGSDGTDSRFITLDTSGRQLIVGAGTAGTSVGGVVTIQGVSGGVTVPVSGTVAATQSGTWTVVGSGNFTVVQATASNLNATVTASGNFNNASVGATAAAPPADATYMGALATTAAESGLTTGDMYPLNITTTGQLRIDSAYPLATAVATAVDMTQIGAVVTTAVPTYTTATINALSLTTAGLLRIDGVYPLAATTPTSDATFVAGAVTTAAPTYTTGQLDAISIDTTGNVRVLANQPTAANLNATVTQGAANTLANAWSMKITDTTNGPVAVTAASTAPVAAQPALVVTMSPNSPTSSFNGASVGAVGSAAPASATYIGALTATTAPTYATALLEPPSLTLGGLLRVDGVYPTGTSTPSDVMWIGGVGPSSTLLGAPTGGEGSIGQAIMTNEFIVSSNATITSSGSQTITKNFYGVQQINLIINVTGSITGTTPTITYTIQELDPGNGTTVMGNSASTLTISASGVYTAVLNGTTSSSVKVSWAVTGTTPSFTGVYATVISKVTPALQAVTTSPATSVPGIAQGYTVTTSKNNVPVYATTYTEQSVNFTGSIVSSSASDAAAGTGARTVTITYVDQTGATQATETATLNGTTAVNLVNTAKCFIQSMVVNTVGTGGANAGTITLFTAAAGGGTNVGSIAAGDKRTFWAHHYVVTGKTCHVTDFTGLNNSTTIQSLFVIQAQSIPEANAPSITISDWITSDATFQVQRTFGSTVNVVGPASVVLFVSPGGVTNTQSQGSFTYYDQ